MEANVDQRDLGEQRDALAEVIERLRTRAFSSITVPPLERALRAMDAMIARAELLDRGPSRAFAPGAAHASSPQH